MRALIVALLVSALLPLIAAPNAARGEDLYYGEAPSQMMDRLRAEALNGKLDAAIAELSDFVRGHPGVVAAARLLGDFYYRKPDMAAAEHVYKNIVQRFPQDRETWNRLGGIYAAEDRVDEAITAFDRSIPEPSAYPNLVYLHRRRGDLQKFEHEVELRAQQQPSNTRVLLEYGNVLRATKQYEAAISVFEQAVLLSDLNRCPALNDLANTYADVGRPKDAIALLQRCLALDPRAYFALVNIGEANIQIGHYDAARPFLERALKENPYRPEAYVDLGFLEDAAGRWKPAVTYYQKAIDIDPLWRDAYVDLGYDYNDQKLYALAEAAYLKGLAVAPYDGRLAYMLGVTYGLQGKTQLARQEYQRAIVNSDEDVVVTAARREMRELR
jgi:tetratricopeptide (TPR) repeat protein